METLSPIERIRYEGLPVTLLTQLPLWLFTFGTSNVVFDFLRLPDWIGWMALWLALLVLVYLGLRWELDASLLVIVILPIALMFRMESMADSYKLPFQVCSVAIASAGMYAYQKLEDHKWRLLVLFGALILAIQVNGHAVDAYWNAFGATLENCAMNCTPVPGPGTTWWALFFTP